ncbi:MAG: hypothetical protein GY777_24285, partial [Candidatus Brocadiaceae bacterium]|nr:hypothetical protein [Candidatus Brocadiaceae bacterium]
GTGLKYDGDLTVGDPIYRDHILYCLKCTGDAGMSWTGVDDDGATQTIFFPITMEGVEDTDRTEGVQLYDDVETITKIV